jgi:tetratricopeptide (TPR) repeat protein
MQEALTVDCPRRSWQDLRQAALAAAQAASGQGDAARLAEPERTKWRKQALMWLRTILEIVWEELEKPIIQRSLSPSQLEALEYEPFYAGLREADALAKLPAEERQTWVQFWTEVDALLQQAGRVAGGRLNSRGLYLLFEKKYTEAEKAFRECLAVREKEAPNSWETFETMSQLGGVLLVQKKYADAEPLLLRAYEGMKRASIPNNTAAGPPGRARSAVEKSYYLTAALGRVISLLELTRESSQTRFSGTFTEASLKQTHEVKLTAGNICVIQLKSPGLMYLDVKDAKETLVFRERHRWEPEQRNSTIFKFLFTPKLDGVYRFVAGSYFEPPLRNVRPNGLGDYEIVVQEYAGMKKSSGK